MHHFKALYAGDQTFPRRSREASGGFSHAFCSQGACDCGELNAKIQMAPFSAILKMRITFSQKGSKNTSGSTDGFYGP